MKVTLVVDAEKREVEVDLARGVARMGGRELPVRIVSSTSSSVELEVAGERVKVDDWAPEARSPSGPVTVDGERYKVTAELSGASEAPPSPSAPRPAAEPSAASPPPPPVGSDAVLPPMPGKVIEVRVREGDHVQRGAVLLILEAMKMRNEVTAHRDGVVRGLRVSPGSSVKAREPMLSITDT
jgi:glutaconyl-CoA decarboxylase